MRRDAYQEITDRIIKLLEEGTVPWQKPWSMPDRHPRNLLSGKKYRGINAIILGNANYTHPYWLTYKQSKDIGGYVCRGEKGYPCVYWNWTEKTNPKTGKVENIPFFRKYTVFNIEQCGDISRPATEIPTWEHTPIEKCEQIVSQIPSPPKIEHGWIASLYNPKTDVIQLPNQDRFYSPEAYYSALFHELTHSTGHKSRLARPTITNLDKFGSEPYGREELIAEMGAAYLCGHGGIEHKVLDNSASYIDGWLNKINQEPRLVVTSASQAQKAADYVLGEYQTDDNLPF